MDLARADEGVRLLLGLDVMHNMGHTNRNVVPPRYEPVVILQRALGTQSG